MEWTNRWMGGECRAGAARRAGGQAGGQEKRGGITRHVGTHSYPAQRNPPFFEGLPTQSVGAVAVHLACAWASLRGVMCAVYRWIVHGVQRVARGTRCAVGVWRVRCAVCPCHVPCNI